MRNVSYVPVHFGCPLVQEGIQALAKILLM